MTDTHAHAAHGPATTKPFIVIFALLCVFTAVSFLVNAFVRDAFTIGWNLAVGTGFVIILVSAGLLLALQTSRHPAADETPFAEGPDDFGPVGDFAFVERSGKSVNQDTLRGKVWIAACFFTCCTDSCPKLSASMTRLQGEL